MLPLRSRPSRAAWAVPKIRLVASRVDAIRDVWVFMGLLEIICGQFSFALQASVVTFDSPSRHIAKRSVQRDGSLDRVHERFQRYLLRQPQVECDDEPPSTVNHLTYE